MKAPETQLQEDKISDPSDWSESDDTADAAIVQDILTTLKDKRSDSKDDENDEDSGYLDNLFDTSNETDPSDAVIENKLSQLDKTERQINLESLGLERFNVKLVQHFQHLEYVYLQSNKIASLSYDFFTVLARLKYLDLRNNRLVTLPCSICYHPCLEVLLLQTNCIQRVPKELGSLSRLRGLQISGNPLRYPALSIISQGPHAILEYLRREWSQYENSTAFHKRQERSHIEPASAVEIKAKNGLHQKAKSGDAENQKSAKSNVECEEPATTNLMPKLADTHPSCCDVDRGQTAKFESIDYKENPVCMFVNKITTKKMKKKIQLPCPDEINDSWSTSQISSESVSKPEDLKPASEPVPSITNTLKRRRRKLQHYSEILNAYEPFRSISAPLDETRTEAMYLRKLVDINRKFIANAREKALQRMKDREALSEWKDEYRALCNSTKRGQGLNDGTTQKLPFAVYEDFQKMMSRQELVDSKIEERNPKPPNQPLRSFEDQQRKMEAKMNEFQKTLNYFDSELKAHDYAHMIQHGNIPDIKRDADGNNSSVDHERDRIELNALVGKDEQKFWLQQIAKMQKFQNETKSLAQLNDTLL